MTQDVWDFWTNLSSPRYKHKHKLTAWQSVVLSEEEPEGDQWTPVTHKRQSPRKLSPKRETEEQRWLNRNANKGLPVGWAEQGSKCDRYNCQQVILLIVCGDFIQPTVVIVG